MSYNERLRDARKAKGLTQAQLGELVGCAKNTISSYESGVNEPSVAVLNKMMTALEVDANYVFQDADGSYRREHATPSEIKELVDPYRALDKAGQDLVRAVLAMETARCMGQNVSFSVAVKQE